MLTDWLHESSYQLPGRRLGRTCGPLQDLVIWHAPPVFTLALQIHKWPGQRPLPAPPGTAGIGILWFGARVYQSENMNNTVKDSSASQSWTQGWGWQCSVFWAAQQADGPVDWKSINSFLRGLKTWLGCPTPHAYGTIWIFSSFTLLLDFFTDLGSVSVLFGDNVQLVLCFVTVHVLTI